MESHIGATVSLPPALQNRKQAIIALATRIEQEGHLPVLLKAEGLDPLPEKAGQIVRRRIRSLRATERLGPWWMPDHQKLHALALALWRSRQPIVQNRVMS